MNEQDIYRHMVQDVLDYAIFLLDAQGNVRTWNRGAELLKQYKPDEVIGRHVAIFFTPEDVAGGKPQQEMESAAKHGRNEDESWRVRKDGSRFWANEIMTALREPDGRLSGYVKISRDLSERRRMEEQLRQSEQRYRDVVEGVADYAIFLTDLNRTILSWNPAATTIIGFKEHEAVGRSADILFTPEDRASGEPQREAQTSITKGRAEDERWHLRSDGSRFWASGIMTARYGAAGEPIGFIKIMRDRTEQKHAEEEMHKLNETLELRVNERTASLLTHQRQLRQLASELGKTEQRERHRLAQELHDHLVQMLAICTMKFAVVRDAFGPGKAPRAAEELRDLLQDAMNYSRSLMAELSPLPLDENDIVEAVEWVAARMKQQGLAVTVIDDKRPKPLNEDLRTVLFQSVRELLYNVVKHARASEAIVSISRDDDQVRIEVMDRGSGFRVTEKALRPTAERGFGLFNIRERLALLGGELIIESDPGQGTRATLVAPVSQVQQPQQPQTPQLPPKEEPRVRLMVVDDHKIMRLGLRGMLETQPDFVVVGEAGNGVEALQTAKVEQPDVIVMDINMPKMNGVEATRRIKAELPEIQVVGLSVHEDGAMEQAMREAGASAYHRKGGAPEEIYQTIRTLVRR